MKKIFLALTTLVLAGCTDFTGQFVVRSAFEANVKNGLFGQVRRMTIPAGHYEAVLYAKGSGDMTVSLKVNGRNEKIRLDVPKDRAPRENGTFQFQAAELKQPFGARGEVRTTHSRGQDIRRVESCTRTRQIRVCRYNPNSNQRECGYETETYYGEHEVQYYIHTTLTNLNVELVDGARPGEALATFAGRHIENRKIYTYQGICF